MPHDRAADGPDRSIEEVVEQCGTVMLALRAVSLRARTDNA